MQVQRRNSVFLTGLEEFPTFQSDGYCLKIDVRYLSERSRKKAERTLNETDEIKEKAVKRMSELIRGYFLFSNFCD